MTPPVQYALLAVVGVLSGLAAQRLSAAVRGSITTRIIRKSLLEGFALVPGIALTSEVLSHRAPGAGPFAMFAAAGAFAVAGAFAAAGAFVTAGAFCAGVVGAWAAIDVSDTTAIASAR